MALRKRRAEAKPEQEEGEAKPAIVDSTVAGDGRLQRDKDGGDAAVPAATAITNDQNGSPRSPLLGSTSMHHPFGRGTSVAIATAFFFLGLCSTWLHESWWKGGQPARNRESVSSSLEWKRRKRPRDDHRGHPCSRKLSDNDDGGGILRDFLHDRREPGLHLVCVHDATVTFFSGAYEGDGTTVKVHRDSGSSGREKEEEVEEENTEREVLDVELLERYLDLKDGAEEKSQDRFPSWAAFSTEGERLFDADSFDEQLLRDHGLVVVLEGGVWRWPGVRVGFRRRVGLPDENRTLTLETLSLSPLVLASAGFLSESECTEIQRLAEPMVRYSEVTLMDKDAGRPSSDFRTSSSTFLTHFASPLLSRLNDRTAAFLRIPRTHQEHLQVLRYIPGEKYDQHHDYFDPELYQNDRATVALTKNGKRNRFATFFWYLSNVTSGGETSFPEVEGRSPKSLLDCAGTGALLVRPELGKVVLFYSLTAAGGLDPRSVHAACPVGPGDVKWAANKWVWNAPMTYIQ